MKRIVEQQNQTLILRREQILEKFENIFQEMKNEKGFKSNIPESIISV